MATAAGPSLSSTSSVVPVPLNAQLMSTLKPTKVFSGAVEPGHSVTALTFDDTGELCLSAGDDDSFRLFNARSGKSSKNFWSKKYGIDLTRFTHTKTNILHASTRVDDAIRYHSLHDNKYISYFKGHTAKVVSLDMNPANDMFISSSLDETVRLWDLRTPHCVGKMDLNVHPVAAWDSAGICFAVADNETNSIHLFDTHQFDGGPFAKFQIRDHDLAALSLPPRRPRITSLSFSANTRLLLVGTSGDVHYVCDAFTGHLLRRLVGHVGLERNSKGHREVESLPGTSGQEVSWTMDSKFVLSGSHDGKLVMWDLSDNPWERPVAQNMLETLKPCAVLDGHPNTGPPDGKPLRAVQFNPRTLMLATAAGELAFWLPQKEDKEQPTSDPPPP